VTIFILNEENLKLAVCFFCDLEMVCISCIVIPVVIWVWFRFIQPLLVKLGLKAAVKETGEKTKAEEIEMKCPFKKADGDATANASAEEKKTS
jgi:hypothetical protein